MKTSRLLLTLCVLALPSLGLAQTSGTISTQTSSPWTTAPWVITSGPGTFPDGGGTATWNAAINNIIGTVAGGATLTLDVPITLSGITYNSPFSLTLAGSAANNLALSASGATFNVQLSIANTPTLFQLANNITAPITGGGSAGLTKIGAGTMTLGATVASTYTGGTHLNGGILVMSVAAAIGDSVLGASGAGNGISMDGGALFNNITGGWTTSRDIVLGAGGGTIFTNTSATLNGIISGGGSFTPQGFSGTAGVATTLTAANTYTGATNTGGSSVSSLILSGNGSIATSSSYNLAGTLTLNNATTNVNDRISDTAAITSRGATIALTGNASAATAENAGALNLANGNTTVTVTPNAAQQATLNLASLNRQNNSTLFVRGTNLGAAGAAGVAQVTTTAAPTLVGGGGAAGSTNISIIPWAVGNTSATATIGSSLVTSGATGLRPLAASEYAAAFGAATDNVRLTAATVANAGDTANAVVFAPGVAAALSGGPINVTSGTFIYSPTAAVTGTVSAGLNFGAAEGLLHTSNTLGVSGAIAGSGGLTINAFGGSTVTLSGANTYTGITTLLNGSVQYGGTVAGDGVTPSVFGQSTTPVVLNGGTAGLTLYANAVATFNRDLNVAAGGPGLVGFGTTGNTVLTMNGDINLGRVLSLEGGGTAASAMVINGDITGSGSLTDRFAAFTVFNGTNTYSGGTNIQTGTYIAGSNSAFGTGTIFFSGAGFLQSSDATARTLSNEMFLGANPTFQGTGALNFTGGLNLNGARSIGATNTGGTAFSGLVSNGALTKTGTGALSLNSATGNTYTGGTVLAGNAGALIVNNTTGSGTGAGTVSIGATSAAVFSTLAGDFNISGATSIAGRLSPGDSGLTAAAAGINAIGSADFGSSLILASATTSSVSLELASSSSFDRITVAGAFTLAGTINITTIGGFVAEPGMSFDLVDWGTINVGTFTVNTSGAAVSPGASFDTSNFATNGTITVVPEPSTWAMMAVGTASLLAAMRFRRRSS